MGSGSQIFFVQRYNHNKLVTNCLLKPTADLTPFFSIVFFLINRVAHRPGVILRARSKITSHFIPTFFHITGIAQSEIALHSR
jgi:hypothetical protein